ncbi:MAG: UDP-N-acetylmuramoyl-tripeptide-D-alanyl-D-alanine ligase [Candidatus Roizmanbacteria bacterium GW2011_GWA2_36_23]|uniref:UDP-N-acetylmuramoyl-tripeptide-D-alanyl-D-alanine ligase n=1 Tax=Candidatus Roizmanbacteria bacterium GW2011_GWA2_36_23 TaxID=1618480 RepID=A0A0G0GPQ7_9BACT|nr:MAG: UDP-N-acetylmuramoyl-tripeptide-D-alanyl-D-alanine ligase [Candidatus Roizmanbacteria bacterium GW2011_GWA2_36_23]
MSYQPLFLKQLFHNSRRFLAQIWLKQMPAIQVAVTGSQGKTNTTRLINEVLNSLGKTTCTDINLDTIYNVPITALKVKPSTKFALFELGIDHPGEMDLHLQLIKPKIAVITGISSVHTDNEHLGNLENLIKEKRKLIEALPESGFAILNYDDKNVRQMAASTKAKILYFGTDKHHCDIWTDPKSIKLTLSGTVFKLMLSKQYGFSELSGGQLITTKLIGFHQIYNIMASYLVYSLIKTNFIKIKTSDDLFKRIIASVKPLSGRMSMEPGPLQTVVLNDSLRANPISTKSGLQTLSAIDYLKGKKIAILAEMGELQNPEIEHKKIGQLIAQLNIDQLICIGSFQKYTADEAIKSGADKNKVFHVKNVHQASAILKKIVNKNDLIYLKGSLLRHIERVLLLLQETNVGCTVNLCPFYNHCSICKYLTVGYHPKGAQS